MKEICQVAWSSGTTATEAVCCVYFLNQLQLQECLLMFEPTVVLFVFFWTVWNDTKNIAQYSTILIYCMVAPIVKSSLV